MRKKEYLSIMADRCEEAGYDLISQEIRGWPISCYESEEVLALFLTINLEVALGYFYPTPFNLRFRFPQEIWFRLLKETGKVPDLISENSQRAWGEILSHPGGVEEVIFLHNKRKKLQADIHLRKKKLVLQFEEINRTLTVLGM